ncbi:MAG TPA: hypothetical protein VGQ69_06400 [Gemmatimonadales bacterium]|nr:hypothetical protein [Gemmatimonadales bacterium]
MRLTWKDGISAVLAAFTVLVALAVTNAWAWPLLGDYRAGTVALTLVGFGMCATGTAVGKASWANPFVAIATLLGVVALVLIVGGLIYATQPIFVALAATIVALWFVSTLRHLLEGSPEAPGHPQAA